MERFDRGERLYPGAVDRSGFYAAVKGSTDFWPGKKLVEAWQNAVADVLVKNRRMPSNEEVVKMLKEQRLESLTKRSQTAAATRGHRVWLKEKIEKLILDRFDKGESLVPGNVGGDGFSAAVQAAPRYWPGEGVEAWENAVADVLVRNEKMPSEEAVFRMLEGQRSGGTEPLGKCLLLQVKNLPLLPVLRSRRRRRRRSPPGWRIR